MEKKIKEIKKSKDDSKENFDLSDIEKNSQDGFLVGIMSALPETPLFESDLCKIAIPSSVPAVKEVAATAQPVSLEKLEISPPESVSIEKDSEISSCVVCEKKFKSKSCMNKHLRSVHAGLYFLPFFWLNFLRLQLALI